ncbi:MAG TPA: hypothetical protein VK158_05790 [Acidobacteriota bacterium]|nr:hypothetical protein [Acidobacteriota bacterium]
MADKSLAEKVITEVAGSDVLAIVSYLKGKKNISEFVIAKDLKQEINLIRNMLYRLLDANLVSFNRKKDKQKGWYIYYWTYQPNNITHLFWEIKKKRLDGLKDRLQREKANVFFTCPSGCIRLEFETAITFDYRCPECGTMLSQQDNSGTKTQLETEINDLEEELKNRYLPPATSLKKVKKIVIEPKKKKVVKKKK